MQPNHDVIIHDFNFMWRGKIKNSLHEERSPWLKPVDKRKTNHTRAILLLHGFSSSPAVYREIVPKLTGYDAIVCPVLPGHGSNIEDFAAVKSKDWVMAVEQTCASLVDEYQMVDVMGLSLGGVLACHLSCKFSLNHLYLLAPALALRLNLHLILPCVRLLHRLGLSSVRNHAGNLCSDTHQELAYRRLPLSTIIEVLTFINEFKLQTPHCPVDVFLGRFDEVVHSPRVEQALKNWPNTHVHWLEKSAHVLPLDHDVSSILHACNR